ncbi:MAG: hypothetical protein IKJ63_08650 [Clostridia bacterium]|nr:hypothetical protein [Clostridia bacterium]
MPNFTKTTETVAEKLNLFADVLVFRPVAGCEDKLFEEITRCVGGKILCVLANTPNEWYRETLSGGNRYFIGKSISQKENAETLKAVQNCDHCVLFASVSMLTEEDFTAFLCANPFSAMIVLQAENISSVQYAFDKRLFAVAELRAQLPYKLPVCAFCATDRSAVLRDIINNLILKTPSRIYPGVPVSEEKLFSQQATVPFTAFENRVRMNKIERALVFCTNRQTAEDAYRYFRFFGYRCAISHGGVPYDKRKTAVDRFATGETDFLFTTHFTQSAFCKESYDTVFLGIPTDVWLMQNLICPNKNIYCFYTQEDKNEGIYKIEEDNEIRSKYTSLLPFNLKTERILQHEYVLQMLTDGTSPLTKLQKDYEHIYFNEK